MKKNWRDGLNGAMTTPVDPSVFAFAVDLFHAAALGQMPGSAIPPPAEGSGGFAFTDIPFNRGMLAVSREFDHLSMIQKQSLLLRLMLLGDAVGDAFDDGRFQGHVLDREDESQAVSKAFQDCYAKCPLKMRKGRVAADLDALSEMLRSLGA